MAVTDIEPLGSEVEVDLRRAIEHLCEPGVITAVVQPIVRPADMVVVGYEALARMPIDPRRPPDWWLDIASAFGLRKQARVGLPRRCNPARCPARGTDALRQRQPFDDR